MRFEYKLNNIDNIAKQLINSFKNKIVIFNGDMGSGKTTIISSIVNILGTNIKVSSPTFSIVNEYISEINGKVYHFDFYRLENKREAFDIGVESYFDSSAYCFVEWPSMIEDLLLDDFDHIYIDVENEQRIIKLVFND